MRVIRFLTIILLLLLTTQTIFAGRYYDSDTGRFLSVDPKAEKFPGWSPYNYCLNNPLANIDPDGKEPITISTTGIAAGAVTIALVGHSYNYIFNPSYRKGYDSFSSSAVEVASETITSVWTTVESLFSNEETNNEENTNPWNGPVDSDINIVDADGNVIPVKKGEQVEGNPDGSMIQVKDKNGKPTKTRKDGKGHPKQKDPKAKKPHGHRIDENGNPITDETGNPHLPINVRK